MNLIGPSLQRTVECEAVLRSLPKWFGLEDALKAYVEDTTRMPTFAVEDGQRVIAFLSLREHFQRSWEIHCMAVSSQARGKGHGSRLLAHSEAWLVKRGVELLQVKTLAASNPSPEYAQTRKFYEARGFVAMEVFPELWDSWNPALQCVKYLNRRP